MSTTRDIRKYETEKLSGLEIVEIKPVFVGGSPIDPRNKFALTREKHIEYVRYWNGVIRNLTASKQ